MRARCRRTLCKSARRGLWGHSCHYFFALLPFKVAVAGAAVVPQLSNNQLPHPRPTTSAKLFCHGAVISRAAAP